MRFVSKLLMLVVLFGGIGIANAQDHSGNADHNGKHIMVNVSDLKWTDNPAGLPAGAKVAVLEGNPAEAGPFTLRIIIPANYEIKPHWHPAIEHVSVIKGTFSMGSGEMFDKAKATEIREGGFAAMPPKFAHFAFSKSGATIQLHGMGPWGITYINPKDDPRNTQK